ncbi:uncharacterized protein LOC110456894 [Mizuhopecten yessoensis]|uniref:uncharacterized protein LOC110456894 n=1 Tax=Mizuhopecten yessoensis TaxID=6573 RepID=UPI000B45828D|nr:uncharacterized protein LOC110456894 [Mizuhopecten yessoensis]
METPRGIIASGREGMWATSIDLNNAYFHIPIRKSDRKYLRFSCEGKIFQFRAMPFGLTTAPMVFTKLLQVVVGFIPSREKLELSPSQDFVFLGYRFNVARGIVLPTQEKFIKARSLVLQFTQSSAVQVRWYLSLLGFLNSLADVVSLGRLHIRPLQMFLLSHWVPASRDWEAFIPLSQSVKEFAQWWTIRNNVLKGVSLHRSSPTMTLYTDASKTGWGAYLNGQARSGSWTGDHLSEHINVLEMRAVLLAIQDLRSYLQDQVISVATDNLTVVAYLQKQGGTRSHVLCVLVIRILLLCQEWCLTIQVKHLPGRLNVLADTLSRRLQPVLTEWQLDPSIFRAICLVCHSLEPSVADVCVSRSRSSSMGIRCSVSGLEGVACLRLSPLRLGGQGPPEVRGAALLSNSGGSLVAESTMVPSASIVSGGRASGPSTQVEPVMTAEVQNHALPPGYTPPSRVEAISGGLAQKGFSGPVSDCIARSIRSSSAAVYQSRWSIFCDWCGQRQVDPLKASVPLIADLLLHLFRSKKLAPGTIAGYRSAIAGILSYARRPEVGSSSSLSALIRGFTIERPRVRRLTPQWNLALVLESLLGTPYEPLSLASLKFLTLQTVFLVTLGSGEKA